MTNDERTADDERASEREGASLVRHEEEIAGVERVSRPAGTIRARKHVEHVTVSESIPVEVEHVELGRADVDDDDDGAIRTLPDGSISIPVYEEELVVTKRSVLKERVIVRKELVTEHVTVEETLRRERVEVDDGSQVPAAATGGRREQPWFDSDERETRPLFDFDQNETRPSFVTSELVAFLGLVAALTAAAWLADALDDVRAWLLVTAALVAYVIARGFSKTGVADVGRR
ncbi:MAG: YsnF/AvaK domain-containing protein [Actinomycetota bacterium]|nr:YsnF/AvaK domain-containing protein [Actinomycetota bacterium]